MAYSDEKETKAGSKASKRAKNKGYRKNWRSKKENVNFTPCKKNGSGVRNRL